MGGSTYSHDDHITRSAFRAATHTPIFAYSAAVSSGKTAAVVHADLDPKGVTLRESRDSDIHPETVPMIILLDVTGSMQLVPAIIESKLPNLMGVFNEDKASGKKYLGEGYPAICVSAVDDYNAMGRKDCLQFGQFESGMEIVDTLEKLWLTGGGGGTYEESYELGVYFAARHTAHAHMAKRGRKGYLFIIGDEHAYKTVSKTAVKDIIGDTLQADIPFEDILREAQELYHVFFVIPNMTSHYSDKSLERDWVELLDQQHVLKLVDPNKICELIAGAVAIAEEHVGLSDLVSDGVVSASDGALVPLSKATGGGLAKVSADKLPVITSVKGGVKRL